MFSLFRKPVYPIGIDLSDNGVRLVQLGESKTGLHLVAGGSENTPDDIQPTSSAWQRWAIDAISKIVDNTSFKTRQVVAALPAADTFIAQLKITKTASENIEQYLRSQIQPKINFEYDDALVRHFPTENDNMIVIATERQKIDRHLAIYEKTDLRIKAISIWPDAMANTYAKFFGRRQSDLQAVVLLIDIKSSTTNLVISRHKNLLFARSIKIGSANLNTTDDIERLSAELTDSINHFNSMYRNAPIERIIFLSGQSIDKEVYTSIAKKLEMPAQMGDCLAAVHVRDANAAGVDRRGCSLSWATAFGLSLS